MEAEGHFIKLNVEKYGGMIMSPWFDRPLSIAGRLVVEEDGRLVSKLVNIDRDLVMIPNLAIHMNRQVNDGYKYNAQKDTLPIFGSLEAKGSFMTLMAEAAGVKAEDILGHDLFLYSRDKGTIWGADEAYLSCGRLDDLQCAFSSIKGLLAGGHPSCVSVAAVFDNEEVGSGTKQGADSTFLEDTLRRINRSLGRSEDQYLMALASSFMVSADNAHAVPSKLRRICRSDQPSCHERGDCNQVQRQPEVYYRCSIRSYFPGNLQKGRRSLPDLCQPFRYGGRFYSGKYFQCSCGSQYSGYRPAPAGDAFPL